MEFAVLFGSRARGDARESSDYDLLVGLRADDGLRLTDRIGIYQDMETGWVQVFPYGPSEVAALEEQGNGLLLEALADGLVLIDRGGWAALRVRFEGRIAAGRWRRFPWGWEIGPPAAAAVKATAGSRPLK